MTTPEYDIGRLTSGPLVEVRTVLARAQTALAMLEDAHGVYAKLEIEPRKGHTEWRERPAFRGGVAKFPVWVEDLPPVTIQHPDLAEMRDALQTTISALRRWARTGPKKRAK